nr:unnamed protein product [Digitaria exilis]
MLTKVSIASCVGRAMAEVAPAPVPARGPAAATARSRRRGEERRREAAEAPVDVVLSYCSSLAGRGPWAVMGRA